MRSWMAGVVLGMLPVLLLPHLPGIWATVALGIAAGGLLRARSRAGKLCAGMALGCALALWHGQQLIDRRIDDRCVALPLTVTGRVASLPRRTEFPDGGSRQRFEFELLRVEPGRCRGPERLLLSYYGPARIIPGEHWSFPVTVYKPWGLANPGSFNLQDWFALTGIDGVGRVDGRARRLAPAAGPPGFIDRLRQRVADHIHGSPLSGDSRAVLAAVTVADRGGIDSALWTLFQRFGISHLLVISGLHIGLVGGAVYLAGTLLQRALQLIAVDARWLAPLAAVAAATAYAALAGFSVATQRALVMLGCFLLAGAAGRYTGSANNLLLAAFVVLAGNPLAALGSGFWLSFGAVAVLLWQARWHPGGPRWRRVLATHGYLSLGMLPLGAFWFGGASLVAAAANLVMIPVVSLVVVPAALLAMIATGLLPAEPAQLLWQIAAWPLDLLLPAARAIADSAWLYQPLSTAPVDVMLGALVVALCGLRLPAAARAATAILLLPLALPDGSDAAVPPSQRLEVTVLDVGQGTAVVVRAGRRTLVYDTGGGDPGGANMATSVLLPYLRRAGVTSLDTLIVSHPDNDHSAGAGTLLAALPTRRVRLGGRVPGLRRGSPCLAGQAWRWPGGQRFQFLSPGPGEAVSSNDSSCVLQIDAAGYRLLLAGDVEAGQERALAAYWGPRLASDWLLVAHHGSRSSSSYALLKLARPAAAVVSSGYGNRFGHPHGEVVARLEALGATVHDTASEGALEFALVPGAPIEMSSYRASQRRFWR